MWQSYVKDILMVTISLSMLSISPISTYVWQVEYARAAIIFGAAVVVGGASVMLASYWHGKNMHMTQIGSGLGIAIFIAGPFAAWKLEFWIWPAAILSAYVLGGLLYNTQIKPRLFPKPEEGATRSFPE